MIRRELNFLKESPFSPAFRGQRGSDFEFDLKDEDALNEVRDVAGAYVIVAGDRTHFIYPQGKSSVIYIGESTQLRTRLKQHLRNLRDLEQCETDDLHRYNEANTRYQYFKSFGAYVYLFYCLKSTQDSKDLESWILWKFYEKHRALPVGNGARSFSRP